jgi:para-nitrobenzyl esterase
MNAVIKLSIFTILVFVFTNATVVEAPITKTKVEGGVVEGLTEDGIGVFKGIPFAEPPVGDLRWKAPQPVKKWKGVLKADKFAPSCPQMTFDFPGAPKMDVSEDCLYLNVWTPATSTKEKLPVMVWIYGGGFAMGSTAYPVNSGEQIAKKGVIMVSIAYRVGALGFMAHPELSAETKNGVSGNYGLLDQLAGLKWVQKNISAFGGDPGKVTIFGESAGGISVSMLCASPLAKGLFKGAISESGGNFGPVYGDTGEKRDGIASMKAAENLGVDFMRRVGVNSIQELRGVSPDKWKDDPLTQMGGFWPVMDGYVITGDQYELYQAGKYNDVNVIIGTNSDEGAMFVRPSKPEDYKAGIEGRFGKFSDRVLELYPGSTEQETYTSSADIFRETAFAWPSWAWANLQSETGKSNVFVYYFDQQQPASPFSPVKPRGAGHAAEIPYVFDHLDKNQFGAEDQQLANAMINYWANFAKTGNPNGNDLVEWPEYSKNDSQVLYLNNNIHAGPVPNIEKLNLMEEYFKWRRGE